jgi:radical SAM superfamily enzyme YgiQ (UPF0313 family)
MGLTLVSFNGMGSKGRHSPSLAVLLLAPVVLQEGIGCDIVDIQALIQQKRLNVESSSFISDAARYICSYDNWYLGFSTRCDTYPYVLEVARRCRQVKPNAVIILGGPQATSVDVLTLETFPFVDIVVRGEGEITLAKLVRTLEDGLSLDSVEGITFRDEAGNVKRNPGTALIDELGNLPFPAYEKYDELYGDIHPEYGNVELGRGCPFKCSFCFTAEMWEHKYRVRTIDSLLEQVCFLRDRYDIKYFRLIHDNVIFKRSHYIEELIARFTEEKPSVSWSASTRVDTLELDLLPSLREAGLSDLYFGIETGAENIKKQLNKRFSIEQVRQVLENMDKAGIAATLSFIIGFPSENQEDMEETLSFALDCAVHKVVKCVQFHSLAPTTGTRLYAELKDRIRYNGTYSNHNGEIPMREASIRQLIKNHKDIFSSFYTIDRSKYSVDLPYAVQEVLGCLVNFFPLTIRFITYDLEIPVLEFLEATLDWMTRFGYRWEYGIEPQIEMEQLTQELYASQDRQEDVVATLCHYEAAVYRAFLKAKDLPTYHPPTPLSDDIILNDLVPKLSPFTQLITSRWEPYALFEWAMKKKKSGTDGSAKPQIARSYYLNHVNITGNGYRIRALKELEFHALRLVDGHRKLGEILSLLESQHGLYRSPLLRKHLEHLFKSLVSEGILELTVRS